MQIGILGTGMVGRAARGGLRRTGHDVSMGTRDVHATTVRPSWTAHRRPWPTGSRQNPSVALVDFASVAGSAEVVVNATSGVSHPRRAHGRGRREPGR